MNSSGNGGSHSGTEFKCQRLKFISEVLTERAAIKLFYTFSVPATVLNKESS